MRLSARERLGFYPLPVQEATRVWRFLTFPEGQCSALDPCVGDGVAFAEITSDRKVLRYGVELDTGRAEQARTKGIDTIHGNCFDVHCPVESFSLIYLNPPYDFEISEGKSQRMEKLFLEHVYRWLKPRGVLVLVVPAKRIADCAVLLSRNFREVRVYRLTEPESVRYKQVVAIGVRRTRQERDRLRDGEIIQAQQWLESIGLKAEEFPSLPLKAEHTYVVPTVREPRRRVAKAGGSGIGTEMPGIFGAKQLPRYGAPTRGETNRTKIHDLDRRALIRGGKTGGQTRHNPRASRNASSVCANVAIRQAV